MKRSLFTQPQSSTESKNFRTRRGLLKFATGSMGLGVIAGCGAGGSERLIGAVLEAPPIEGSPIATPAGSQTPVSVGPVFDGLFKVQLALTSSISGSGLPWYCAQPCARGHLPPGSVITVPGENIQSHVESTWPDGSARIVILTGYRDFTANAPISLTLLGGGNPDGAPMQESSLLAAKASVTYGGYGTVSLTDLIGTSALLRTRFAGPLFSEFHYWAPFPSDSDLGVWFYCKVWKNGRFHVRVRVENGRNCANAASPATYPATKTGIVTVTIADMQRYSASTTTYPWCGWDIEAFDGAQHTVRPKHDTTYLRATRLVPNYAPPAAPSTSALGALEATYAPGSFPNLTTSMGSGGADPTIGLLMMADAMYITSNGDARAFDAVVAAGRGSATYPILLRDPTTKKPLRLTTYPGLKHGDLSWFGGTSRAVAATHMPTFGYMAYLLTGEYQFLETVQHAANMNWFLHNNDTIGSATATGINRKIASQIRGRAWWFKQMAASIAVSPVDDPVAAEHKAHIEANLQYFDSEFVAPDISPLGCFSGYLTNDAESNVAGTQLQPWQYDFFTQSIGWANDLDLGFSDNATKNLKSLLLWSSKSIVGRLGAVGDSDAFDFRFAGVYLLTYSGSIVDGTPASIMFTSWRTVFESSQKWNPPYTMFTTLSATVDNTLRDGDADVTAYHSGWASGYVANYLPALAYAVDYGATGAEEAQSRVIEADNWNEIFAYFSDQPQWAIMPRSQ